VEEKYYHLPCSNCGCILRLTISPDDFGRFVEATCSRCGAKTKTTIIDQEKLNELMGRLSIATTTAMSESNEVAEAMLAFREAGFEISNIAFGAEIIFVRKQVKIDPKVKDGQINIGTFSPEDESWAKKLKIKLGD